MIAIIADDFTGAAEVAGICLCRGVTVSFIVNIPEVETLQALDTEVLVLAEDTRSFTADGAEKISRMLAENLKAAGITRVVKKIDSVLRGWVLPEMRVLASVLGKRSLMIQPANTATHRSIRQGLYYVENTLLTRTSFGRDPEFPAQSASVRDLLEMRSHTSGDTPLLPYEIPDAVTEQDLAACVARCDETVLPGGSADFWRVYLEAEIAAGRVKTVPVKDPPAMSFPLTNCLLVCGSAHQNSLKFYQQLVADGFPTTVMPESFRHEEKPTEADFIQWIDDCVALWEKEHRLLIRVGPQPVIFPSCAERLRYRLTEAVYYILQQIQPAQLLIEGGATAWSLLQRLGWNSFNPIREWLPGVVQLQLKTPPYCYITLKPGSYAWPQFSF